MLEVCDECRPHLHEQRLHLVAEDARPAYAEGIATARDFSLSIVRQATRLLAEAGVPYPGSFLTALTHTAIDHALAEAGEGPGIDPTASIQG